MNQLARPLKQGEVNTKGKGMPTIAIVTVVLAVVSGWAVAAQASTP